jgi:hypothetical protein
MKQHNHIKSNRPTRSQSPGEFFITAASLKMLFLSISDKGALLRNCCGNCVFFRDEVPESTALNQKKLPFQEVRKKDLSVYFFPSLLSPRWVYVPQWKCPTHSNVHLLLQTADQPPTHPPARVVFCSRQFIPSPKRRKSNMCTQNEQMQYQTRVLLGGVFTIDQLLGY